ncbi:ATP-binding protein [Parafrankia sp. BMG5.11]|uniref:sensor histidine kinase n=1 Tax=Parafrankia sp. BMG5.11 TaxID=222540 RepID=UPI00103F120D|nr:sensor histidine kinase [Parafrankia sp. BMG5.11]TCJ37327.1 histidine kinase [Parafrankia sp. BMG5.11]
MPERRQGLRGLLRFEGNRPVVVLLAAGLALLVIAILVSIQALSQVTATGERVEQSLRVQAELNRLISINERVETARRGYLLSTQSDMIDILQESQAQFTASVAELRGLAGESSDQIAGIEEIERLRAAREEAISQSILSPYTVAASARENGLAQEAGTLITRRIRTITDVMREREAALLFNNARAQSASQSRFYVISGGATALLLLTLIAVIVLMLRFNRDLGIAQVRLRQANEGLEAAVNARTLELTRANEEIQRFAYIVSHDLRSPLVNVLGFTSELDEARKIIRKFLAELFERDPDLRDQAVWLAADEDLPEALDFIRKSTEKMDRLINSILELSRQGRRPLTPELLDMDAVADGVAASLYQRAETAGAEIVIEPLPDVHSDRIAVEQILSNLTENALKYLSPKRPGRVEISGRKVGPLVEIAVKDNGRGIDPADHERVFELFRRAGTQDQPGEGIGLANVRALAYRLGGTIRIESQLDEGATFTLSLPLRFTAGETVT